MIARQDYRVRVAFRREDEATTETRVVVVSACDLSQALDLAVCSVRFVYDLTPYDEVSATPEEPTASFAGIGA